MSPRGWVHSRQADPGHRALEAEGNKPGTRMIGLRSFAPRGGMGSELTLQRAANRPGHKAGLEFEPGFGRAGATTLELGGVDRHAVLALHNSKCEKLRLAKH